MHTVIWYLTTIFEELRSLKQACDLHQIQKPHSNYSLLLKLDLVFVFALLGVVPPEEDFFAGALFADDSSA
jgi:hypothetical protein